MENIMLGTFSLSFSFAISETWPRDETKVKRALARYRTKEIKQTNKQTKNSNKQTNKQTNKNQTKINKQSNTNKQTNKQKIKQKKNQTNKQTNKQIWSINQTNNTLPTHNKHRRASYGLVVQR